MASNLPCPSCDPSLGKASQALAAWRLLSALTVGGALMLGVALLGAARIGDPRAAGPTYSVAQVQAGLQRHPDRWAGRVLVVRGGKVTCAVVGYIYRSSPPGQSISTSCLSSGFATCEAPVSGLGSLCLVVQPFLVDAGQPVVHRLPLAPAHADPVVGWLRTLPLVGSLVPPAPPLQFDVVQTYTIRIDRDYSGLAMPSGFVARVLGLGR
jgi:hypothetical protein